jgi:hypothetical protein
MTLFTFPEDAEWNADSQAVEFSVAVGEYTGRVRVSRRVFQRFLAGTATPEKCLEAYHLHRTRLERAVEAKLRRRELANDGNIELTGRDIQHPDP